MICFPNAKINLGLNIVSKRDDGYHNLETVFYPIMIKDALEIIETPNLEKDIFVESGIKTGTTAENNLVMKALHLIRSHYSIPPVEVHLLKQIPFGAGIGGGSSDAAFMLKLINSKYSLGASSNELAGMASQLGADCPFFIYNKPMFATGIGEKLEEVEVSFENYYLILVKPEIFVSTKDAFASIEPKQPDMSLKEIIKHPIENWKNLMVNDFEKSIFPKYPMIEHIKQKLYALGAVYASMSGSGSSVYGIFNKKTDLKHHFDGCFVWEQE
ncbi:4-(cytidine 5'-diphospho)-2-C-methyl-D-erythritol kinase [Dysgonomonas macrotermitis]|uniref:4-diphosphocytidyl-2-C-methyl-D-erythritol kinase n=1 Tax=Dysgonomonas macrotermitis TaxID=1346286 RepID=A0A1M5IL51_9BACT|nr:4-(cytidine 5'-diphospho)-2-C-methyl-D-erythritol kinase [Dysgonomonas macrotermitis]SHG29058.1 4-diphosphocytidyl-2-C-methyl-D-erythritol kinase [Dysgonomonas macrotermitis]